MFCRKCGKEIANEVAYCPGCGTSVLGERTVRKVDSTDRALGYIVPINVSWLAVVAGYAGLLAITCFTAPIALILGFMALKDLQRNPGRSGKGRAIFAVIMGTVFTFMLIMIIFGMISSKTGTHSI